MSPGVESRLKALEDFLLRVNNEKIDTQVASDLCKLGSVVACGTIERCIELIILDRLNKRAHPRVLNFIKSYFKRGTNYDCEEIEQLLRRFDPEWCERFCEVLKEKSGMREAVSSCYAVRNSVAHGGSQSIGPAALSAYCRLIIDLIIEIDRITKL